jgi:hypothetical protein
MAVTVASVITSTRLEAKAQADGRLAVREGHQADGGEYEERAYLAEPGADLDALLELHGRLFLERLARK